MDSNTFNKIEILLIEIFDLIVSELGSNPYEDLDKMLKIVVQKNYNQKDALKNKLKNFSILLYNRRLENQSHILDNLNKVYELLANNPL